MPLWRLLPMTLIVLLVACSRPPLVDAVDRGDEGAVAALLASGADVNVRNPADDPVLTVAIRKGYIGIAQRLLNL